MKLLLDTHLLLWAGAEPEKLSPGTRELLLDPSNEPFFSAVSIWEIAIKTGLGRADFSVDPVRMRRVLLESGYREVAVNGIHAAAVLSLPPVHKDPFDRMLFVQAREEGMTLLTVDERLAAYGVPVRLV